MKKKFIISLSSIILIYLAICLFFVFSYNSKLEKLNPSENCIYTTDLLHTAAASGRWCGAERPRCGLSNSRH